MHFRERLDACFAEASCRRAENRATRRGAKGAAWLPCQRRPLRGPQSRRQPSLQCRPYHVVRSIFSCIQDRHRPGARPRRCVRRDNRKSPRHGQCRFATIPIFFRPPPGPQQLARTWRRALGDAPTGRARGVWQPRFWEHTIRDEDDFDRNIDYVHDDPVKHGLVVATRDWPRSSFHRRVQRRAIER